MPAIAGLDIATTTGLATLRDGVIRTTTWRGAAKRKFLDTHKFGTLDPMVDGDIGRRFADFLECWLIDNEVIAVALEGPIATDNKRIVEEVDQNAIFAGQAVRRFEKDAGSLASSYRINGMSFLALSVCARLNIPRWMVAQSTWRKEFLGHGRPADPKAEAKKQCEKLGIEITSADAAEAVGIVTWLDRTINPTTARRRADDLFASPAPG